MTAPVTYPDIPVAVAVRRTGRTDTDPPVWIVQKCPYCHRRHVHGADPVMHAMKLPARCNKARFYLVEETDGTPSQDGGQ